jgi:hypothetical protein
MRCERPPHGPTGAGSQRSANRFLVRQIIHAGPAHSPPENERALTAEVKAVGGGHGTYTSSVRAYSSPFRFLVCQRTHLIVLMQDSPLSRRAAAIACVCVPDTLIPFPTLPPPRRSGRREPGGAGAQVTRRRGKKWLKSGLWFLRRQNVSWGAAKPFQSKRMSHCGHGPSASNPRGFR